MASLGPSARVRWWPLGSTDDVERARDATTIAAEPPVRGLTRAEASARLAAEGPGLLFVGPVADLLDQAAPTLAGFGIALLATPAVLAADSLHKVARARGRPLPRTGLRRPWPHRRRTYGSTTASSATRRSWFTARTTRLSRSTAISTKWCQENDTAV